MTSAGSASPFGPSPFAAVPPPNDPRRPAGRGVAVGTLVSVLVVLVVVLFGLLLAGFNLAATQNLQEANGTSRTAPGPDRFSSASDAVATDVVGGDCVDVDVTDGAAVTIEAVCTESHDAEVFAVAKLPSEQSDAYPGADLRVAAKGLCVLEFAPYAGDSYSNATDLEVSAIYPSRTAWKAGTRDVACLVHAASDGATLDRPVRD